MTMQEEEDCSRDFALSSDGQYLHILQQFLQFGLGGNLRTAGDAADTSYLEHQPLRSSRVELCMLSDLILHTYTRTHSCVAGPLTD